MPLLFLILAGIDNCMKNRVPRTRKSVSFPGYLMIAIIAIILGCIVVLAWAEGMWALSVLSNYGAAIFWVAIAVFAVLILRSKKI